MSCRTYNITVVGVHEHCCKKCRRVGPRGQDVLDRTPVLPEPGDSNEPVVVQDIND